MDFHFFAASEFVDVLVIAFEGDNNVSIAHYLHDFNLVLNDPLLLSEILEPKQTLLIAKVYVCFVSPSGQAHIFDLLFVKDLI
jgi:hypothetical protein